MESTGLYAIQEKFNNEESEIALFAEDTFLRYKLIGDKLIVVNDIAYWKIVYLPGWNCFALYHGNRMPSDIDPEKYVDADYHYQRDAKYYKNIYSLFVYIKGHDDFRCRMIEEVEAMPRRTKKQRIRYNRVKQKQQEYKKAISMQMIHAYINACA